MKKFKNIFVDLDKTLAIFGIISSIIITLIFAVTIRQIIYIILGLICTTIFLFYLLVRKNLTQNILIKNFSNNNRIYVLSNIIFYILYTYSVVLIYFRAEPYIRPFEYFITITLTSVVLIYEIIFLNQIRRNIYYSLFKIILIGLNIQYSQILIYPNVIGIDSWYHQWFVIKILDTGFIPKGLDYSNMAFMQIMTAITSSIINFDYKITTLITITSMQIIMDVLYIFLIGKFLINVKIALMASLILQLSSFHIYYGYLAIPNTSAAILILPIIFLIFKLNRLSSIKDIFMIIIFSVSILFTHSITTMFISLLFLMYYLSYKIYSNIYALKHNISIIWSIFILFSIMMFVFWSQISGHMVNLVKLIEYGFIDSSHLGGFDHLSNIPFQEIFLNNLGLLLFFSISMLGCLYMFSAVFRNNNKFTYAISGGLTILVGFTTLITGRGLIAQRWFLFAQLLLVIPLILGLYTFIVIFKNSLQKNIIIMLLFSIIIYSFIITPEANIDNHLFSPNTGFRPAFTKSEIIGAHFLANNAIYKISSDFIFSYNPSSSVFLNYYNLNYERITSLDSQLSTGNFIHDGSIKIIRNEIINKPFNLGGGTYRINYDPNKILINSGFNKIFDNLSIIAYINK